MLQQHNFITNSSLTDFVWGATNDRLTIDSFCCEVLVFMSFINKKKISRIQIKTVRVR